MLRWGKITCQFGSWKQVCICICTNSQNQLIIEHAPETVSIPGNPAISISLSNQSQRAILPEVTCAI